MLRKLAAMILGGVSLLMGQAIDYKDIRNTPFVYARTYGVRCDGTTNNSSALASALAALPASGGRVVLPPGVCKINSTLTIGNGSGSTAADATQSSTNNIILEGQGAAGGNYTHSSATTLLWGGASGGTVVRLQGPVDRVEIKNLTIDGNDTAGLVLDVHSCINCGAEKVNLRGVGANGWAQRLDAIADYNGNTANNYYRDMSVSARSSGASCLDIGPTYLDYNAGNFNNVFENYICNYANDTSTSYGVRLGWADNNTFIKSSFGVYSYVGSGYAIRHVRQTPGYGWLPSENSFLHTPIGCTTCNGISGDAGDAIGTIFFSYQTLDSSGLNSAVKGVRGWLHNGDFFDSSNRMAFQNRLHIYERGALARLNILGFAGNAGTGTISSSGTSITGSGTSFTTQLVLGKMIAVENNIFRKVTGITDDTHATIEEAFDHDLAAGTGFSYQTGANSEFWSDSDTNFNTDQGSNMIFRNNGAETGHFDRWGNFYTTAGVYPSNANRQIRSGSGSPEGVVSGNAGDLWMRTDGDVCTSFYVKETYSSNTGWAAVATSSCPGGGSGGTLASVSVSGTINGVNAAFTLGSNPTIAFVYVNGVLQVAGTHYTRSGTAVTFDSAWIPGTGDIITVYGWN